MTFNADALTDDHLRFPVLTARERFGQRGVEQPGPVADVGARQAAGESLSASIWAVYSGPKRLSDADSPTRRGQR